MVHRIFISHEMRSPRLLYKPFDNDKIAISESLSGRPEIHPKKAESGNGNARLRLIVYHCGMLYSCIYVW